MLIVDLNYAQNLSAESESLAGGFASVNIDVSSGASGQVTFTFAKAQSYAASLPYGGSVAFGGGTSFGFAYNPPSYPSFPNYPQKFPK